MADRARRAVWPRASRVIKVAERALFLLGTILMVEVAFHQVGVIGSGRIAGLKIFHDPAADRAMSVLGQALLEVSV